MISEQWDNDQVPSEAGEEKKKSRYDQIDKGNEIMVNKKA